MRTSMVVAVGAGWVLAAPVLAVETSNFNVGTTRDLVELCSAEPADPLYAEALQFCYGYMAGAAHFYRALMHGDRIKPIACPEREVTRQEVVGAFLEWARANAQHMEELPVESVVRAAVAEWPCDH